MTTEISGVLFMLGMTYGFSVSVQWSHIGLSMAEERVQSISLTLRNSSCFSVSISGSSYSSSSSFVASGRTRGCLKLAKGLGGAPPPAP